MEDVAFLRQRFGGLADLGDVVLARGVALGDGRARVGGGFSVGFRLGERDAPARQAARDADYQVRVAVVGVAQVPAGVGGERDAHRRQADPPRLVAVAVHVGHYRGVFLAALGGQLHRSPKMRLVPVIQPHRAQRFGREDDAGDALELLAQGVGLHRRAFGEARMARRRRRLAVPNPLVEIR